MIYIVNSASIGLSGLGMMQFLTKVLVGSLYYRHDHAGWGAWVHMLRPWALPTEDVVTAYYDGHASFFDPGIYVGWIQPIIVWSCFLMTLLGCFYCVATLLRRQWMDAEQLQFPIAVIPLEACIMSAFIPVIRLCSRERDFRSATHRGVTPQC